MIVAYQWATNLASDWNTIPYRDGLDESREPILDRNNQIIDFTGSRFNIDTNDWDSLSAFPSHSLYSNNWDSQDIRKL